MVHLSPEKPQKRNHLQLVDFRMICLVQLQLLVLGKLPHPLKHLFQSNLHCLEQQRATSSSRVAVQLQSRGCSAASMQALRCQGAAPQRVASGTFGWLAVSLIVACPRFRWAVPVVAEALAANWRAHALCLEAAGSGNERHAPLAGQ